MTADFDGRIARLEEHLVAPSAEDELRKAEQLLARDEPVWAGLALSGAKLQRAIDASRATPEQRQNDR